MRKLGLEPKSLHCVGPGLGSVWIVQLQLSRLKVQSRSALKGAFLQWPDEVRELCAPVATPHIERECGVSSSRGPWAAPLPVVLWKVPSVETRGRLTGRLPM